MKRLIAAPGKENTMTETARYGIIARFESAAALVAATESARQAGYTAMDAHSPFPVPGLAEALGFQERRIPLLALGFGLVGAGAAFFMQWYSAVIDYPFVVGGKPLNSWPAFLPITFEVGILAAVLTTVIAMFAGNGLPRPYHPVFNDADFERASADGFFLVIEMPEARREDPQEEHDKTSLEKATAFLQKHGALSVRELAS
jgi:hypothetical protein